MHTLRIQILAVAGCVALLALMFELLRKRRLREEYALLWVGGALVCLVFATFRGAIKAVAEAMGIYYPPAAILLVLLGGAYLMLLHFSLVFSSLSERTKRLTQEVGLLRLEIERLGRARSSQPAPETVD